MTPVTYRRLAAGDSSIAAALVEVFAEAFEDSETYPSRPPSTEYTERLLAEETFVALVAFDDRTAVIGGLVAYELPKLARERSEIYLYDLAVLERHRRQGVASGLIAELGSIAERRNAEVIFVQAEDVDAPAIALYTKLATTIERDVTHFDLPTS